MRELWNKWKVIAEKIGNFQFKVIFSILYLVIFTPIGILSRLKFDFLNSKNDPKWEDYENFSSNIKYARKQ